MTDLKTPYLDKEIKRLQSTMNLRPSLIWNGKDIIQEYQQIKAALKRLEELEKALPKIDKAAEVIRLTNSDYPDQCEYQKASEIRGIIQTLKTVLE